MDKRMVAQVYGPQDVSPEQVEQELESIWEVLRQHPELVEEVDIDLSEIALQENPFHASRPAEGVGIVEGILIAVAGRIAGEVAIRLWDNVVWPRLQTRIAGIRQQPAKG